MQITKKRVGGGLILASAVFLGQETFAWLFGKVLDLATQGFAEMSWSAFPWQSAAATIAAIVGAYLAFWPSKKQPTPNRAQKFHSLWVRADDFVQRVRRQRALEWHEIGGPFNRAEDTRDIARDGISLLMKFDQAGIATPDLNGIRDSEKVAVACEAYFTHLAPFMRDGHISQVIGMAKNAASNAEQLAISFDPHKWIERNEY